MIIKSIWHLRYYLYYCTLKVGRSGGQARAYSVNQVAPKGKVAMLTRVAGGQKTIITWQDAPDDLFYKASGQTKKVRVCYCLMWLYL